MRSVRLSAVLAVLMPLIANAQLTSAPLRPKVDAAIAAALGTNRIVHVQLVGGSAMYGHLEPAGADSVVIVTEAVRVTVARTSIRSVASDGTIHKNADGSTEYWFPNPNKTRLFFAPTGRTLAQGEGYVADYYVAFAGVTVGVTDRITLGGGTLIVPSSEFWFLTPKVGIVRTPDLNVAVGALVMSFGDSEPSGLTYAVATFGSTDRSLTAGLGYGFAGSDMAEEPVAMLGAESRLSKRVALVTENYFISGVSPLVSYGLRFMGEKISVDLALINILGKGALFPGIPFVDFVVKF